MVVNQRDSSAAGPLWSMAAVARETGLTQHTLRAWERRFGTPRPIRLASGHRRFAPEQVAHLRLVARLLDQGHRISDLIHLPVASLEALLTNRPIYGDSGNGWTQDILNRTRDFDRDGIAATLTREASRLGVREFLRQRLEPLVVEVGDAWAAGRLDIRHEHFLSEILQDTIRALRSAMGTGTVPPPLLLATLPGELHGLGLQMAALTAASLGRAVAILGVDTPVDEVAAATRRLRPIAVGISVSSAGATPETAHNLNLLKTAVGADIPLWVGGSGAGLLDKLQGGIRVFPSLDDLADELAKTPVSG